MAHTIHLFTHKLLGDWCPNYALCCHSKFIFNDGFSACGAIKAASGDYSSLEDPIKKGELLIVGAVYDFSNDMKNGSGKLNIININGATDNEKIKELMVSKKNDKKPEEKH